MYTSILNQNGEIVFHRDLRTERESFLSAIAPY